jgi:hypothetical protein
VGRRRRQFQTLRADQSVFHQNFSPINSATCAAEDAAGPGAQCCKIVPFPTLRITLETHVERSVFYAISPSESVAILEL